MSKAAELAKWGEVSTNGQVSGRRNIVINGAMNVAQRSASVADIGAAAGYFTVDRWKVSPSGTAGRLTMTQTADGPTGFANCLKLDCTTADTSIAAGEYLLLQQIFEGQDVQAIGKGVAGAKEITVSFYVKANAAFTFGVELEDLDNGRGITKLFNTTTGWVRHEFVIPADVDDGSSPFDDDNASSLSIQFWLHAGATFTGGTLNTAAWANHISANRAAGIDSFFSSTDNNFFITGVQLEVGSVATPFEHRSYGEELALCQRYYQVYGGTAYATIASGVQPNTTNAKFHLSYMQEIRTAPSIAVSDVTELIVTDRTAFDQVLSGLSGNVAGKTSAYMSAQFSAQGATGRGILLAVKDGTTTTLSLDSEL
jgi:hypothetical protein